MNKQSLRLFLSIVIITLFLSIVWEFFIEEWLSTLALGGRIESDKERWEYVITSTVFVALASVVPIWILFRAEEVSRKSREQFKAILENTPAVVYTKDVNGRYLFINSIYEKLFKISSKEVVGKRDHDIFPKEMADAFLENDIKVLKENRVIEFEEVAPHDDGHHTYISLKFPLVGSDGTPYAVCGISTDITERTKNEKILQDKTDEISALIKALPDIYFRLDENGTILEYGMPDDSGSYLFPKDFLGKRMSDTLPLDVTEKFNEAVKESKEKEKTVSYEYELKVPAGDFSFEARLTPLPDNKMMVLIRNITDRKRFDDALKESERQFRTISEAATVAIYMTDADGKCTYANPLWLSHAGISFSDALGDGWIKGVHPDDRNALVSAWGKVIKSKSDFCMEYRFMTPEGRCTSVLDTVFTIKDDAGSVTGYAGLSIDITKRKEAEGNLISATEEMEKANILKDKFLALASHDLRSPIATILGLVKMLRDDPQNPLSANSNAVLNSVANSGQEMLHLIDELLSVSRFRIGRINPSYMFINVHEICQEAFINLQFMAQHKEIKLINKLDHDFKIYADRTLISEVLKNLLVNACKFTNTGGSITISREEGYPSSICIQDTGVGISDEKLKVLFDYESGSSTVGTEGEAGIGLGLPLCKEIIDAHKGEIGVESKLLAGSRFCIRLPDRCPKILLVDDDTFAVDVLKVFLSSFDVTTFDAYDGEEALKIAKDELPDLIILDIAMPLMDGFELLSKLKASEELRQISTIVTTGSSDIKTRNRIFDLGANDFIEKPFKEYDLIPRVKKLLFRSSRKLKRTPM